MKYCFSTTRKWLTLYTYTSRTIQFKALAYPHLQVKRYLNAEEHFRSLEHFREMHRVVHGKLHVSGCSFIYISLLFKNDTRQFSFSRFWRRPLRISQRGASQPEIWPKLAYSREIHKGYSITPLALPSRARSAAQLRPTESRADFHFCFGYISGRWVRVCPRKNRDRANVLIRSLATLRHSGVCAALYLRCLCPRGRALIFASGATRQDTPSAFSFHKVPSR